MTGYYFWGFLSSGFFLSAIPALVHQLLVIDRRKHLKALGELAEPATQSISLNQIFSSFFAVYSFFLFGLVADSPDPFLTIPRAIVGILFFRIIIEIHRERRTKASHMAFFSCIVCLIFPFVLLLSGHRSTIYVKYASNAIICLAVAFIAQGNIGQYLILKHTGKRGAVSLPMHLVMFGKDLTGMIFGLEIGPTAWSIILMHSVNLVMRTPIILTYLRIRV